MNNVSVQDKSASGEDSGSIDWNTDDELEIQEYTTFSSSLTLATHGTEASAGNGGVSPKVCISNL